MTEQQLPAPAKKPWYKKWWVWLIIIVGVLIVVAALSPTPEEEAAPSSTTSTTQESETTTTTPEETTTTRAPTTTTTLPPILAEGSGRGDDVVNLELPSVPVVVELTHAGSSNFAVWSLDAAFENVDLLVNTIGDYDGIRPVQWEDDETVTGLEITADGNWTYEIRPLLQEPQQACLVEGTGDSVVLLTDFTSGGGAADLTHNGTSNFAIWAWGSSGADLLVNEIGGYEGTVRVSSGLFAWDITADGDWTINC